MQNHQSKTNTCRITVLVLDSTIMVLRSALLYGDYIQDHYSENSACRISVIKTKQNKRKSLQNHRSKEHGIILFLFFP